jgi:hypothetical protein
MAKYADATHKVTILGDMFAGVEEWTTSFYLGDSAGWGAGSTPTVAEAQAIAGHWKTFWQTAANQFSSSYRYLGVKVSHVGEDGKSPAELTQFYMEPAPVAGPYAASIPAPQLSLVATLATLKARGKGSKGRMYLPGIGSSVTATGKIDSLKAAGVANTFKVFLDSVNADAAVPGFVMLNSAETAGVPYKAPELNRVASVRVGDVFDTQRRRRNALQETYSTAVLA